eukprot:713706-Prorocentrum_minimum.AAC.1
MAVTENTNFVFQLWLVDNMLTGTVPSDLQQLTSLKKVYVAHLMCANFVIEQLTEVPYFIVMEGETVYCVYFYSAPIASVLRVANDELATPSRPCSFVLCKAQGTRSPMHV